MLSSRPARAPVVALLAALLAALVPAAAHAAERREVSGGRLDWGVKSSFQAYVTGPIAGGSTQLQGGAATVGGQFRFHSAKGSYDPGSGAFEAGFSGGVRFTGHKRSDGGYELDLTISRPTVRLSGSGGTLYADMRSKAKGSGQVTTASRVPLAALDLSGVDLRGGGSAVTLANVPATLTAQGASAFAGYYTAGTALDPVALSADVVAAAAKPAPPSASPSVSASAAGAAGEKTGSKGEFTGAAVDWGVRRSFREYVTGPVAQGSWKLTDGARDGGALFRFPGGKGTYDAEAKSLDAAFDGTLRFTGKHLDLTLGAVKVAVKDGKGTLSADVSGSGGGTGKGVPLATFAATGVEEKDGLVSVAEAPAELTAEGAKAFGGVYREGTEMDPVSLAVPIDGKAPLPALPDLGSGAASPGPSPSRSPEAANASVTSEPAGSSFPVVPVTVAGAALLLAAAAAYVVVSRKRRSSAGTSAD
ncbi:HtaA domain-containing protein [Streptomyces sp. NPDC046215]|uniref:HtaA domain-containing protein n=1 Tax=Streptomyces stramineus TaxID=173861 RepID=A0ABP3JQV0_9ACTN